MAYTTLDSTKPTTAQTRQAAIDSARTNLNALRDAILMGQMQGFAYSQTVGTGTAEQPQFQLWTNGAIILRATNTWGAAGGATGNLSTILWELSVNTGSSYDTICTETRTYDGSGNMTASTNAGGWTGWLGYLLGKVKTHIAATGAAVHGLGTMALQAASAVAITGGTVDGTDLGNTTQGKGTFTRVAEKLNTLTPGASAGVTVDWAFGASKITTNVLNAITFANIPAGGAGHWIDVSNFNQVTWPAAVDWGVGGIQSIAGRAVVNLATDDSGTKVFGSIGWRAV